MEKTGNLGVIRKIGTISLAFVLALSQWPAITLAAAEEPGKNVVKEIEGLSEDVSNQKLHVGALESEISFPETLTVKVVHRQEVKESEEKIEETEKDIEAPAELLEAPADLEEVLEGELGEEPAEVPATPDGLNGELEDVLEVNEDVEDESEDILENPEKVEEKVEDVQETPEIDEEQTDEPETTDESLLTGFVDFVLPSITVKAAEIGEEVGTGVQSVEAPSEVTETITVPVTWSLDASRSSTDAFSSENPGDYFVYQSKIPEGYECQVELPSITVTIVGEEEFDFDEECVIDGVKIRVTATKGVFPNGATLSVSKVSKEQEEAVIEAVEETSTDDEDVVRSYTFDIKVLDKDGNEIQPADASKVKVSFTLDEISDSTISTNIYHMKEDDTDLTAEKLDVVKDGCTATAETDGFSIYALRLTASIGIEYVDENGDTQTITKYTEVDASLDTWEAKDTNDGWFVVNSEVEIDERITVNGKVKLILCDGAKLEATKGITVSGADNALTIYGQTIGNGEMKATGDEGCAGIGGGYEGAGNNITINGGTVTASGRDGGAGIGGGNWKSGNNITINGGIVTASGGYYGAGIGGGNDGAGNNITINGGTVTASGGYYGAGIGGGFNRAGEHIIINSGTVTASGGDYGAGIGGGYIGQGHDITINGGEVTATGGFEGAGIGGGSYGVGNNTTISGGTVTASGGFEGAGIGGGYCRSGDIKISGSAKVSVAGGDSAEGIGSGKYGAAPSVDANGLLTSGYIREHKAGTNIYDFSDATLIGPPLIGTATHLVHFYENGGSGTMSTQVLRDDNVTLNTNSFYREYYNFVGWNTKNDGSGVAYADEAKFTISIEELHLYAQWTPTQYTITYDLDGGKGDASQTYTYEDTFSLKTPTKTNYKFKGWKVDTNSGSWTGTVSATEEFKNCYGNVTLVAQWKQPQSNLSVSITDWTYGETANLPSISNNQGTGEITYEYKVTGADDSTYTTTVPTDVGNYTVRATVAESDDYLGGTATADFEITKATPMVSVDSITKTYDGAEITKDDITGAATYKDIQVPGTFAFENDETFKDVSESGDKTVIFTPDDIANYESVETTLTLTINPKDATVKADNKSKIEGDVEPELTATVTGLLGKDFVDYILSRLAGETAGDYAISPSGSKLQGNYSVSFENGILTIKAAEKTEIITINTIQNNQQNSGGSSQGYYSIPIDMPENMPSSVMRIVHPQENLANDVVRTVNRRIETPIIPEPEPETADAGLNPPTKIKEDKTPKSAMQVDSQETVVDGSSGNLGLIIALAGLAVIAALVSFWQIQCKRKIK